MASFAECLAALPSFRNDLARRQQTERPFVAAMAQPFGTRGAFSAFATPLSNVHATGVGIRLKDDRYNPDEYVIKVFVFDKIATTATDIPTDVGDAPHVAVDVEHMPVQIVRARTRTRTTHTAAKASTKRRTATAPTTPQAGTQRPQRARRRPIVGGISISPLNANFVGTLGCFLRRQNVDTDEIFALSNNHVLANVDQLPVGTRIVQPGPEVPPFTTDPNDAFASLHSTVPIQFPGGSDTAPVFNRFDAAIANVTNGDLIQTGRMFGLPAQGLPAYDPSTVPTAVPGMRVMKMGRTTGFTRGMITATNVQGVQVNYGTVQVPRIAVFQGVIRIIGDGPGPFSSPGDSGSVILEEQTGRPVALLFAGDGTRTTACELGALCQRLGAWPV